MTDKERIERFHEELRELCGRHGVGMRPVLVPGQSKIEAAIQYYADPDGKDN